MKRRQKNAPNQSGRQMCSAAVSFLSGPQRLSFQVKQISGTVLLRSNRSARLPKTSHPGLRSSKWPMSGSCGYATTVQFLAVSAASSCSLPLHAVSHVVVSIVLHQKNGSLREVLRFLGHFHIAHQALSRSYMAGGYHQGIADPHLASETASIVR